MFSQGMFRKTFLFAAALTTVLTMVLGYWYLQAEKRLWVEEKQRQLLEVAAALERNFDNEEFYRRVSEINSLPLNDEEKALSLNAWLQPTLMELSRQYPEYGMGVYCREIDRVVAVGPLFDASMLQKVVRPEARVVYATGMPNFARFANSTSWPGKSVLNLAYPIIYSGEVIGYTWANVRTDRVEGELGLLLLRLAAIILLLWLITLLGLRYLFAKLQGARQQLITQMKSGDDSPAHFTEFPELVPLLETVSALRRNLMRENEEKERISREIARLDRLNLIGEMAAGVAHEIRNPMTVVRGYVQRMLQRSPAGDRLQLEVVLAEIDRVNGIITDFLLLARNKRIEKRRHDLNALVRGLYPLISAESNMHSLCLELKLAEARADVLIDENEIKQLILNLARNAIEATGGKGTVTINTEDRQDIVRIRVTDDGRGIPAECIHKVFDPFFTTKDDNTGLGLAICKSIVERHGGQITLESLAGLGTTVTVCLPKAA